MPRNAGIVSVFRRGFSHLCNEQLKAKVSVAVYPTIAVHIFNPAPAGTAPAGQRRSGRRSGNTLPASSLPQRPMGSIHRLPRCHKADAFIWQRYATCNGCIVRSASCCRWKPGPPPPGFRVLSQDGANHAYMVPGRHAPVTRSAASYAPSAAVGQKLFRENCCFSFCRRCQFTTLGGTHRRP